MTRHAYRLSGTQLDKRERSDRCGFASGFSWRGFCQFYLRNDLIPTQRGPRNHMILFACAITLIIVCLFLFLIIKAWAGATIFAMSVVLLSIQDNRHRCPFANEQIELGNVRF